MAAAKKAEPVTADKVVEETEVEETVSGEGITGFSVTASISEDFGQHKTSTTLHYTFGRAVEVVDIATTHHEMRQVVSELELENHAQHVKRATAEAHQATQQVQPQPVAAQPAAPAPGQPQAFAPQPPAAPGGPPFVTGAKPNGGGTIRYIPSNIFPTDAFEAAVKAQLAASGEDPSFYEVWDNRVGQFGLESGNASYSVGAVKPAQHHPLLPAFGQTQGGNAKAAFYIEFGTVGEIVLKPSKEFTAATQPQQ